MDIICATIFDFDDTIMATKKRRLTALRQAFLDMGHQVSPDQIEPHWGKPFPQLIQSIVPVIDYTAFHGHYSQVMRQFPPEVNPGSRSLLNLLRSRGIPVFVISSGSRDLVKQDLETALLWPHITQLWGCEDTPSQKPDPQTMQPILDKLNSLGLPRKNAIYVGDSLSDLQVASENRIHFCAVLTGDYSRCDFEGAGLPPHLIVESLKLLLQPDSWFIAALKASAASP